ncbi:hypothetical protein [Lacticaseibacillus absianus]|uniref:hypothetical protein n=1 Tax=Lacticaseibacillus absianus TaxID=2729623 RepID=UPI0015CEA8AB|nr:hypothetical protein [Lacticaseibacillus absianus]
MNLMIRNTQAVAVVGTISGGAREWIRTADDHLAAYDFAWLPNDGALVVQASASVTLGGAAVRLPFGPAIMRAGAAIGDTVAFTAVAGDYAAVPAAAVDALQAQRLLSAGGVDGGWAGAERLGADRPAAGAHSGQAARAVWPVADPQADRRPVA